MNAQQVLLVSPKYTCVHWRNQYIVGPLRKVWVRTKMWWRNITQQWDCSPLIGPTNTRWCGRLPRQEKGKRTTGEEACWKPCTSANSSTPTTRTVVWPVIFPGYHCLTNHPLDKFNHAGELIVSNYAAVSINNNNQFAYTELLAMMTTACWCSHTL